MSTLFIDGQAIPFEEGQTIIDAALAADVYVPHLCHRPGMSPHGSCKLCTVNINGRQVSACTTQAQDNMQVSNNTPELTQMRKTLTQMLFIEGNHICPGCEKTGNCTLQAVGYHLGMLDSHFAPLNPRREIDASHPDLILDRDRCIMCALCVQASQKYDGKNVFALAGRGNQSHLIVNSPTGKLGDSDIDINDMAAHICPVGAILIRQEGYQVPIGRRTFDLHLIAEPHLDAQLPLTKKVTTDVEN